MSRIISVSLVSCFGETTEPHVRVAKLFRFVRGSVPYAGINQSVKKRNKKIDKISPHFLSFWCLFIYFNQGTREIISVHWLYICLAFICCPSIHGPISSRFQLEEKVNMCDLNMQQTHVHAWTSWHSLISNENGHSAAARE